MKKWIGAGIVAAVLVLTWAFVARGPTWPETLALPVTKGPPAALSSTPDRQPFGPEPDTAISLKDGAPDLQIALREKGWEVTATPQAVAALGSESFNGPAGVYWAGEDRALFRWYWGRDRYTLTLADLRTGQLQTPVGFQEIESGSPDGRFVLLRQGAETAVLVDMQSNRVVWELPAGAYPGEWLDTRYLRYDLHDDTYVADLASRVIWTLKGRRDVVAVVGGQLCTTQSAWEKAGAPECWNRDGTGGVRLLPADGMTARDLYAFKADAAGQRLAFAYRSVYETAGTVRWSTGVAYASKPLPPMYLVDTVAVYDAAAGTVRRMPLPSPAYITGLEWSPDGAYLGLNLHPDRGYSWSTLDRGDLWSLEVGTGRMQRVCTYGGEKRCGLWGALNGGALLVNRSGAPARLEVLAPGQEPQEWRPSRTVLNREIYMAPKPQGVVPWLALTGQGELELVGPDGADLTWPLADELNGTASAVPAPGGRWAAVLAPDQAQKGRLLLLGR